MEEDNIPDVDDIDGHTKPNLETSKSLSLEEKEEEGKLKHRDSLEKLQLQYQRMMSRNSDSDRQGREVSNGEGGNGVDNLIFVESRFFFLPVF